MTHVARQLVMACALAAGLWSVVPVSVTGTGGVVVVSALSADPALVTGGDVLLQVTVPEGTPRGDLRVTADGRDVTSAFVPGPMADMFIGLVDRLPPGPSTVTAEVTHLTGSLALTNYPITGPVISGPHQQPFICQTDAFTLPDGSTLGPPLDEHCSARTVVQYIYRPRTVDDPARPFRPVTDPTVLPADVAQTTTTTGQTVNFIVRVETGTLNRGIYQNAVLHDPTSDPRPSPTAAPRGWNRRLIAMHGVGCPSGWYIQGAAQGINILDPQRLGDGYALFTNTLNHPTNSCNAFLAGETTMMGKEHFIETFGVPQYTMSTGASGGAYTSLQVADAFPGLIDGVLISATFPDALSIALSGLDAHLLTHYFTTVNPSGFTEAQQVAVSGFSGLKAFIDAANQAQRTDPVPGRRDIDGYQSARWNKAVPESLRYHPQANPRGARPTVFDAARNIYGVNPATGAARRPFDNVGVQYGLLALRSGAISLDQFLDLNEAIGGYDDDANYVPQRTGGDLVAIRRTYQSGLMLGANGGLTSIPIVDNATSNEAGGYHYGWFHFALRERLRKARGGRSDNMVMWRSTNSGAERRLFDTWMTAFSADRTDAARLDRVLRARPATGVDGCFDRSAPPAFVADALPFTSAPDTPCSRLYPVYSNVRAQAGGPLAADVLKCQLKPVEPADYGVALPAAALARLKALFPEGVCDWTKPGVHQVPVVTWASFGPSPRNRID
ncbi:MAG: DUF6351 family protein [Vicinamibacterales bacterium]